MSKDLYRKERMELIEQILDDFWNYFPICSTPPEISKRLEHLYSGKNHRKQIVITLNNAYFRRLKYGKGITNKSQLGHPKLARSQKIGLAFCGKFGFVS